MTEAPADRSEIFREMFRRHAAGVVIVTASHEGVPYGFTATSLASLSADPPRFTFNMARTSSSWSAVANADFVGVHMLGLMNRGLADRFARTRDRFEGDHWRRGAQDVPLLHDVTGWLVGRIVARLSFESNAVIVAEVVDGAVGRDDVPLLYHGGAYGQPSPLEYEI